jgi:hypothetical protein
MFVEWMRVFTSCGFAAVIECRVWLRGVNSPRFCTRYTGGRSSKRAPLRGKFEYNNPTRKCGAWGTRPNTQCQCGRVVNPRPYS